MSAASRIACLEDNLSPDFDSQHLNQFSGSKSGSVLKIFSRHDVIRPRELEILCSVSASLGSPAERMATASSRSLTDTSELVASTIEGKSIDLRSNGRKFGA